MIPASRTNAVDTASHSNSQMWMNFFDKRRLRRASVDRGAPRYRSPATAVVNYEGHSRGEERVEGFVVALCNWVWSLYLGGRGL